MSLINPPMLFMPGRQRDDGTPPGREDRAVSRQMEWVRRKQAQGLCTSCGKPREHYAWLCDTCHIARRILRRKRYGYKAKRPGGPGPSPRV